MGCGGNDYFGTQKGQNKSLPRSKQSGKQASKQASKQGKQASQKASKQARAWGLGPSSPRVEYHHSSPFLKLRNVHPLWFRV